MRVPRLGPGLTSSTSTPTSKFTLANTSTLISILLLSLCTQTHQQQLQTAPANANSKRGLPYPGPPSQPDDYALFFSANSSIRWYYNWTPTPSRVPSNDALHPIEFLPMVHGVSNLDADIRAVKRLSTTNENPDHKRKLLSFNEPDGAVSSGGSDISPADAAAAYIKYLVPLRDAPYNMSISHPSVTGTGNGLNWLREFNQSCHDLQPGTGCPTDFVSVHLYGDTPALAGWVYQLNGFYNADPYLSPNLSMYVTEFALVQSSAGAAEIMLNSSMALLDGLSFVAGYAWFGLFRSTQPNSWTGPGNALLDGNGSLTSLASTYLGGSEKGFFAGAKGSEDMFDAAGWTWGVAASGNGNGGGFQSGSGSGDGTGNSAEGGQKGGIIGKIYNIGNVADGTASLWVLLVILIGAWIVL